jgi:hypothetical protein
MGKRGHKQGVSGEHGGTPYATIPFREKSYPEWGAFRPTPAFLFNHTLAYLKHITPILFSLQYNTCMGNSHVGQ